MNIIIKTLFEITVYSSVMTVAVLAMKAIWNGKISGRIIKFLWMLVLIRLLLPVTFDSPVHLEGILPKKAPEAAVKAADTPVVNEEYTPAEAAQPYEDYRPGIEIVHAEYNYNAQPQAEPPNPSFLERAWDYLKGISIWTYTAVLWAAGAAALLFKTFAEYLSFRARVMKKENTRGGTLLGLIEESKAALGIKKNVSVVICGYLNTPVTFGIAKPVILLPRSFANHMERHKLKMILLHELCHIKNRDVLKNMLWLMAKAVHWFNPLVWAAYRYYLEDVELACDETVISLVGEEDRFAYSQSLIDVVKLSRAKSRVPATPAFCEDKTKIRKRVENMIEPKKKLKTAGFVSLIMAAVLIVGCFTTACQPKPDVTIDNSPVPAMEAAPESENIIMETIPPEPVSAAEEDFEPAYTAPDKAQKDLTFGNGTINIKINAEVVVPKTKSFPIYSVEPVKLTQEKLDNFLDEFFPERTAVATSQITQLPTKEKYQKLIDEREEWIATKDDNPNERGPSSHELWQQEIDFYKEQLKDAPDTNLEIPEYDITKFSTIPLLEVFWDAELTAKELEQQLEESKRRSEANNTELIEYDIVTGDSRTYSIYALHSDDPHVNIFWISSGKYYSPYSIENYSDIPGLETTYNEACSMAEKAVKCFGLDYMSMNFASISQYTRGRDTDTDTSYHFVFTRDIGGANITYTQNIVNNPETDYRSWQYNYFEIWVDDDGITKIEWHSSSSALKDMIAEDSALLPFEDIMDKAEESFETDTFSRSRNSYEADQMLEENRAKIYENDIIIDKITLGYMRVTAGPDDTNYKLIPVWDFIGRESIRMDVTNKKSGEVHEAETEMPEYGDCHSFLTINAIDGTVLNRRKGY